MHDINEVLVAWDEPVAAYHVYIGGQIDPQESKTSLQISRRGYSERA